MAQVMRQKKIVAIGRKILPLGLKLAGVKESYMVADVEEAEPLLLKLLDREDIGIIVIAQGLANGIKDRRVRYRMENSIDPVVLSVPDQGEKMGAGDALRELILRAVGIDMFGGKKTQM